MQRIILTLVVLRNQLFGVITLLGLLLYKKASGQLLYQINFLG